MVTKTIQQLKKELFLAKAKNKKQNRELERKTKALRERKQIEDELKELTRSKLGKSLKRFSKNYKQLKQKNLTPERRAELRVQTIARAKKTAAVTKKVWNGLGFVVNKLSKMGDSPVQNRKPTKGKNKRR